MLEKRLEARRELRKALALEWARSQTAVEEAQRLRFKVFAEEMGARIADPDRGVDCDLFDSHCEHLLVRDSQTGEVVGTYRLLNANSAREIGAFYSDHEFDLTRLAHLRGEIVEVGRSCVHPDYRNGAVITLLWSGLAQYMITHGYGYLIGCASIRLKDGGQNAASIYHALAKSHLAPAEYRVFPRCELPLDRYEPPLATTLPPLIKGYMRVGAHICGAPAWDPDFNTADLLMMLPLANMASRYARHFLKVER
jgi:putative hemolysin